MATVITTGYSFGATELVTSTKLNQAVNSATIATIADTDMAQITTASKVSGTALTGLASVPAGAGVLPIVNVPALQLLSATTISLAADADTTIYTVPAGKRCILSHAILVAAADAGTSVISIGANGAETNFIPNNTLSAVDAQYDAAILMPVPNTTPTLTKSYAATTVIEAKVSSHAGAAGNTLYLFGYIY